MLHHKNTPWIGASPLCSRYTPVIQWLSNPSTICCLSGFSAFVFLPLLHSSKIFYFYYMKLSGFLVFYLLTATATAYSQPPPPDPGFPLFFNGGMSFTHARDAKINRWLKQYGYPAEPRVPTSYNFDIAAMPANSRLMYTVRLSTINTLENLSSYSFGAGLYSALVKKRSLKLLLGGAVGFHDDIITLNGRVPAEYREQPAPPQSELALRRSGLYLAPGARLFWYPVNIHNVQLGLFSTLGYDVDLNSRWRLGYYSNDHGEYDHFREIEKPDDQSRVTEYGVSAGAGLSICVNLH
jgi:hypothetical protein